MFLVVRIVDVIWDPIVGAFVGGLCHALKNNRYEIHF